MSLNTLPFNPFPPSSDQKGSGGGGSYVLPIASAETLGGVKVGEGLTINGETGVLSADSQIVDYSTAEQATGQKWIDEKDIYVKSFEFTSFTAGLNNLGAVASDVGKIVNFDGVFIKTISGTDYVLPLSRYDNETNYNQVFIGDNIMLNIADGDFSTATYKLWLNVYYTKTETEE